MNPIPTRSADHGAFLLRIALGVLFLAHGLLLKWMTYGLDGTAGFFQTLGLPAVLAYVVTLGETFGGIALILGVAVRPIALFFAAISFGAIIAHTGNGWVFSAPGGGWEFPVFLGVVCLVQALLGAGSFAFAGRGRTVTAIPAGA